MPSARSVTRKLWNVVDEPNHLSSNDSNFHERKSRPRSSPSSYTQNGKTTRSIIIEKKRIVNKIAPKGSDGKTAILETKEKSKEILLRKHLVDTSVNTLNSGPMRSDNVGSKTIIRKSSLRNSTADTRARKNLVLVDKACYQNVNTVSCGTQFLSALGASHHLRDACVEASSSYHTFKLRGRTRYSQDCPQHETPNPAQIKLFMGARRWSLSKYPRGPDFY